MSDDCREFNDYYDSIQEKISHISVLDELLAGMSFSLYTSIFASIQLQ